MMSLYISGDGLQWLQFQRPGTSPCITVNFGTDLFYARPGSTRLPHGLKSPTLIWIKTTA
jgi:hypothetical protein